MQLNFAKIIIFVGCLLPFFALPVEAAGLVPCTDQCNACNLFELISNIVRFITWGLAPFIAGLMLAVGGIMLLIAGGDEGRVKQGKGIITQAVVGLIIIFLGWLIVNTIITSLAVKVEGFSPETWYRFKCEVK